MLGQAFAYDQPADTVLFGEFREIHPHQLAEFIAAGEAKVLPQMIAARTGCGDDVGDQQFAC